nr:hypothetical protein [Candidatus Sigynarchaeota archaeon]
MRGYQSMYRVDGRVGDGLRDDLLHDVFDLDKRDCVPRDVIFPTLSKQIRQKKDTSLSIMSVLMGLFRQIQDDIPYEHRRTVLRVARLGVVDVHLTWDRNKPFTLDLPREVA